MVTEKGIAVLELSIIQALQLVGYLCFQTKKCFESEVHQACQPPHSRWIIQNNNETFNVSKNNP